MKRLTVIAIGLFMAIGQVEAKEISNSTWIGGAIGAGVGAVIGHDMDGRKGAIVGAAIGGAAGAAIGHDMVRREERRREVVVVREVPRYPVMHREVERVQYVVVPRHGHRHGHGYGHERYGYHEY